MKTVRDVLRNADPLRYEPYRSNEERDRLREAVLAAASQSGGCAAGPVRRSAALLAALCLMVMAVVTIGSRIWSREGGTLEAAVRFEVRLAETRPGPGLREARVAGSDRVLYLHQEIIVTNDDISQSHVIDGNAPSRFGIAVTFNTAGAEKIRRATASHVGGPLAILIDGEVVSAPTIRDPIGSSAVIDGDFTRAEAELIANGMSI
jgi:hypothetical protein